ncbi:MAG: hypothetical protein JJE53_02455 [Candidatus Pacebacteria bacterium]|nr:hypothetical protein [Candidatus Paceibacterota bacterium]
MIEKLQQYIEYVKTPEGFFIFASVVIAIVSIYLSRKKNETNNGGRGGNAKVNGNNSTAIGGLGGGSGSFGNGGDGGNAEAIGDNCFAMGGEGGEAGQLDRGGKGGRSPFEILGHENIQLPDGSFLWDKGRGGDGAGPSVQEIQKEKFEENKRNSYKNSAR